MRKKPTKGHAEDLGYLFKELSTQMETLHNNGKEKRELTYSQFEVLIFLYENSDKVIYQTDIEKGVNRSNPTITGILNRLELKGFIKRVSVKEDRRYKQIVLTNKALELREKGEAFRRKNESSLTEGMTEEEIKEFKRLLMIVIQNVEKAVKEEENA